MRTYQPNLRIATPVPCPLLGGKTIERRRAVGRLVFLVPCLVFSSCLLFVVPGIAQDASGPRTTASRKKPLSPKTGALSQMGKHSQATVSVVADPDSQGGESTSIIQIANLIYAGTKTSECFSDHFLQRAEHDSAISTSRRLHSVKLSSDEIYNFPMLIMTGEGEFQLLNKERENLRQFIERGGFLLASAGCSSTDWDRSFRREMVKTFANRKMKELSHDHMVFHTVYDIERLKAEEGEPRPLVGIHFGNRLGVLYSQDGLNDTSNTQGCCCCGGNEITNAEQINVNILVYSLL